MSLYVGIYFTNIAIKTENERLGEREREKAFVIWQSLEKRKI